MRTWLVAMTLVVAVGCGDDAAEVDAAPTQIDASTVDAGPIADANAPLTWVDFTITGCAGRGETGDAGGEAPCLGEAPLSLRFTAIAPAAIANHQWRFGGGDAGVIDERASPVHSFDAPGSYDVALAVEGPGGTAGVTKPGVVVVAAAGVGGACQDDGQCASGACLCDGGGCDGFATGVCSAACEAADGCGDGGVCADLDPTGAGGAPWRGSLCVADCSDAACPAGLACQSLRGVDGGWVRGCFAPGQLGALGDSCADPDGVLDSSRCASGACLALGLHGVCSADCATEACPAGAACATFAGGTPGPSCLASCEVAACDADPELGCAAPGAGFTVDAEPPADDGYCAPLP